MRAVKRIVFGGLAAFGLAAGITLSGVSSASAMPPSSPGTNVGDRAYGQSGDSVVTYRWNGNSWTAVSCRPFDKVQVQTL